MLWSNPVIYKIKDPNFCFFHFEGLDSGGINCRHWISDIIRSTGLRPVYQHAHEWCCGHGIMGYTLLQENICESLTLSDCSEKAVTSCLFTATANNIEDKANIFCIENFDDIPVPQKKWDLVIGNPPYVPDYSQYYLAQGQELIPDQQVRWIDPDWKHHINFFQNLKSYITSDCDIYLWGINPYYQKQIAMAKENGLKFLEKHDDDTEYPRMHPDVSILHFRPDM